MKKVAMAVLAMILAATGAWADPAGRLGAGVVIGSPIGPTVKYWLSSTRALNAGIGFDDLAGYVDYEWHSWNLFPPLGPGEGRLAGYAALGGKVEEHDYHHHHHRGDDHDHHGDAHFGVRTLVGATYFVPNDRIEIFVEAGPVFLVAADVDVEVDAGVGVRFYFASR